MMVRSIDELHKETGLSKDWLKSLLILTDLESGSTKFESLASEEILDIQNMLVSVIGNMDANKSLKSLASLGKFDSGVSAQITGALMNISYRTRQLKAFGKDFETIWNRFESVTKDNKTLKNNEKITLKQFGILYDLASLGPSLTILADLKLIEGNKQLEELHEQVKRAAIMVKHLDNTFEKKFKMPIGTVIFDDLQKKSIIYGHELSNIEKLGKTFVTRYGHASKGILNKDKANRVSHINPYYMEEAFSLRNYLYSDLYQIKLEQLIDKKTQSLLKEHLGDDWLTQLENQYTDIERTLHDSSKLHDHVTAEGTNKRFAQVTLASLVTSQNLFFKQQKGSEIHDEIYGKGKWQSDKGRETNRMLCSEFVGKTTVAAIHELNEWVVKELKDKGAKTVPDVVIKSPISEKEKLSVVSPERLLKAMIESGAVERIEMPQELSELVFKDKVSNEITKDFKKQLKEELKVELKEEDEKKIEDDIDFKL